MAVDCHVKYRGWSHLLSRPRVQVERKLSAGRPRKVRSGLAARRVDGVNDGMPNSANTLLSKTQTKHSRIGNMS